MSKRIWYEDTIKQYIENEGYIFIKLLTDKGLESRVIIWCGNPNHNSYEVKFSNFKNKRRCPYCANEQKGNYRKFSYEEVKEYIEKFGYKLLSTEYKNNNTKLLIQCDKGHKYNTSTFSTFKDMGHRCPYCNGGIKHTIEEIREYVEGEGYKLLSEVYMNDKIKILIKCPNPNHSPYEVRFSAFKYQGTRCPYCNESKGEKEIVMVLDKYNIEYIRQYNFKDCKGKRRTLPFDFYLPQYNICIEYDGQQHYKLDCFNYTLLDLMNRKYLDDIKTKYCEDNNIKLIRIPYWDFDKIEGILKLELK